MIILRTMFAIVGLCGLLLLSFAVYFSRENILMIRNGILTKAVVAEGYKRSVGFGNRKGTQYFAYIDFKNEAGKEVRADVQTHKLYKKGDELSIRYLSEDNKKALVFHWFGSWWLPVLLAIVGLFLCYLGFAQFFVKMKP
jgi:hypothetical protein